MYYVMRASAPSLHRESTDSLVLVIIIVSLFVYMTEKECNGTNIQITGGQTALDGIVEICEDEVWVPVCDDKWDYRAATVVCRQLGYEGSKGKMICLIMFF